ncbi:MAG: ATP-binding cassette domain-containing protein [Eubacteriales bacterium]|nr:ATP-binding cassette domain-containing protein [Eubacteriales bacterium]
MSNKDIVQIRSLKKYFNTPHGKLHAVDDVTFCIEEGKTMGIVGESGCGKSTLGRMLVHLEESTSGEIIFDDEDVTQLNNHDLKKYREKAQIIFQDPYSSLDPRYTVESTIQEPLLISGKYRRKEAEEKTKELMELVGIAPRLRLAYPHELDGGRRQRVGIARALALDPKFIVCDEPVSALDVSIQAQVLNLLKKLQQERGLTYMFITHNLSVVKHISDNICVMYLGQLVETCPTKELFEKQLHPYTKALLSAIPSTNIHQRNKRIVLNGELKSPINPAPGCRFIKRCPYACEECNRPQKLVEAESGHFVACCKYKEINNM